MQTKAELRTSLRKSRQIHNNKLDFWKAASTDAFAGFSKLIETSHVLGLYLAVGSEVDPMPLAHMEAGACKLALPRVAGRGADMEFRRWTPGDALERADFGFLQPLETAIPVIPDIIVAPLVGFDAALNRLGQGAGHYDRYFSNNANCLRIGLAWSIQQCDALPADPWDQPLDAVFTEKGWILRPNSRITLP